MDACNERSAQRWWPRRGERGGGDQERLQLVEGARQLGIEEEERLLGAPEEREGCEAVDLSAHHLSAIYVCEAETSAATIEFTRSIEWHANVPPLASLHASFAGYLSYIAPSWQLPTPNPMTQQREPARRRDTGNKNSRREPLGNRARWPAWWTLPYPCASSSSTSTALSAAIAWAGSRTRRCASCRRAILT